MRTGWIKRTVSAFALLCLVFGLTAPVSAKDFDDVRNEDWLYPAVDFMSDNGYMVGTSDKSFSPDSTLSRAMFVTVLYRFFRDSVGPMTDKSTDVPNDTWYTNAVAWALENGVTGGTSATTFSPNDPVTREQMAVFIKRCVDNKGISVEDEIANITANTICPPDVTQVSPPADLDRSSDWAKDAVSFASAHRLLLTDRAGNVNPRANATRTDAVVAFYNLLHVMDNANVRGIGGTGMKIITLTQQTTGDFADLNKEFVYYSIDWKKPITDTYSKDVEKLKGTSYTCTCGLTLYTVQENTEYLAERWDDHVSHCPGSTITRTEYANKFTLKNGESIKIRTSASSVTIFAEPENGYSLLYSANGTDFINVQNDKSIRDSELMLSKIKFTPNGTFTIRRTLQPAAS